MIEIGNKLLSSELFKKEFVCNLSACKGACCVEGNAGAPVEPEEAEILEKIYPKVRQYLTEEGRKSIENQGTSVAGIGELEKPLNNGKECAYVFWGTDGTALCAIEQAYNEGKITWQKPLSCHLYPIRIKAYKDFDAINYDKWEICSDACVLGKELHVPVYKFLKTPLIRKYGEEWYKDLEEIAALVEKEL